MGAALFSVFRRVIAIRWIDFHFLQRPLNARQLFANHIESVD